MGCGCLHRVSYSGDVRRGRSFDGLLGGVWTVRWLICVSVLLGDGHRRVLGDGGQLKHLAGVDETGIVGWAETVQVDVDDLSPIGDGFFGGGRPPPGVGQCSFGDHPEVVALLHGDLGGGGGVLIGGVLCAPCTRVFGNGWQPEDLASVDQVRVVRWQQPMKVGIHELSPIVGRLTVRWCSSPRSLQGLLCDRPEVVALLHGDLGESLVLGVDGLFGYLCAVGEDEKPAGGETIGGFGEGLTVGHDPPDVQVADLPPASTVSEGGFGDLPEGVVASDPIGRSPRSQPNLPSPDPHRVLRCSPAGRPIPGRVGPVRRLGSGTGSRRRREQPGVGRGRRQRG